MEHHQHSGIHQNTANTNKRLIIALLIVIFIMAAEVVGGLVSNSLALLGDAGHMLVDALALVISIFALNLARRPANASRTFGYHRAEILAALANGFILLLITAYIMYEAYQRFLNPPEIRTGLMLVIAVIGLVANAAGLLLLNSKSHSNLNIRGAFLHILGDAISSVGVIAGSIIISLTGWNIIDPILAVLIGIIILWGAFRLVKESAEILLEAVPKHIKLEEVTGTITAIPGVEEVHDVHVWTITSGIYALSLHVLIRDTMLSGSRDIISKINRDMAERFGISHTTIQLECEKCDTCAQGLICQMNRQE